MGGIVVKGKRATGSKYFHKLTESVLPHFAFFFKKKAPSILAQPPKSQVHLRVSEFNLP